MRRISRISNMTLIDARAMLPNKSTWIGCHIRAPGFSLLGTLLVVTGWHSLEVVHRPRPLSGSAYASTFLQWRNKGLHLERSVINNEVLRRKLSTPRTS